MDNNLQFILSLKDVLTPAMLKAGGVADDVSVRIQNDLKKITGSTDALGRNDFGNKMAVQLNTAKKSAGELNTNLDATKSKFAVLGEGAIGWIGSLGIAAASVNLIKDGLKAAAEYEQQRISFGVMTGSQAKGDALLGSLRNYANVTPYEQPDVTGAAQTLLQFGVDQNKILPEIKMLGDVAAGSREKLQSLSLAYAQVQATGRLQGQDLLQLVNAGFNPLLTISKETGISMADLKKKMEQGAIGADLVTKAFQVATSQGGQFYQMTEKQSQTLAGRWSTLMDTAHNKVLQLGQAFAPAASKALDFAIQLAGGTKTVAESVKEETEKIYGLYGQLTAVNTSEAERKKLLDQLKEINPKITEGIDEQSISYSKLAGNIASVTAALNQQKIAEQFRDDNAKLFSDYARASQTNSETSLSGAGAMAKIYSLYPQLAANTTLTQGQKELEAQKLLRQTIAEGKQHNYSISGTGTQTSTEEVLLNQLHTFIKSGNEAREKMYQLLPEVQHVQSQIKTATGLANKGLGITDPTKQNSNATFTPTDLKTLTTTSTGKDKADSINSGGQRSIVINIAKQTGAENIYVGSNKEAANEIESMVRDAMRRVLLSINGNAVSAS